MIATVWTYIESAILQWKSRRSKSKRHRKRDGRNTALRAEHLERRELLSTTQVTFDNSTSAVTIQGTADSDNAYVWNNATQLHVRLITAGVTSVTSFELSSVGLIKFWGGDGDDQFQNNTEIASSAWGGAGKDSLIGGAGNDFFFGGADDDKLVGGAGDDRLYGEEGNDRLLDQSGNDTLVGGTGDDQLYGGADADTLVGGDGADLLYGEDGDDRLWGQNGNDTLIGGAGNDQLYGGADHDTMAGYDGDDLFYGEDGNDRISGHNGNDTLVGGAGDDQLYGGADFDTLVGGDGDDKLYGEDGDDRLWGQNGLDELTGGAGNDLLLGGADDDRLFGGDGDDRLYSEDGNDRLWGQNGNDTVVGGAGNDQLYGGADLDTLVGGDGDDLIYGEDGNDRLWGQNGNDELMGGVGHDQLYGGADLDMLAGNEGDDLLVGEDGDDRLLGSDGIDRLEGGGGNDRLHGGNDDDVLLGGDGDDQLYGEVGNDQLLGDAGNDRLEGGAGHDVLVGGDGGDYLAGNNGNTILIGGRGADTLSGQGGENLLIGGTTSYDSDLVKLRELGLAWAAAIPYSMRIQQIEDETFTAHLVSTKTVFEDGIADSIFGGEGQDWFFQTGSMEVYLPHDAHHHETGEEPGDTSHHPGPTVLDHPPDLEGFDLVSAIDSFNDRQANEAIHSKLPHADDPVLQREHLTLFQLVRYDQVSHYAVHDGAWSDPATWHNGIVPTSGARVLIPLDVTVQVDTVLPARLSTVRVDGTLSFVATVNTELRVDTMVVAGSGTFEMGTAAAPINPGVTARLVVIDSGPIDRTADPFAIGRGLISHGKVSIVGAEISSYGALASPALAGANVLAFQQVPVGWKVGDTLVVAGTTGGTAQNEVRRIAAVAGALVMLDQPLSYSHLAPATSFAVHVANMTRNAVIESESTVLDRRGHVMFMHNPNVTIANAGFYRLGRTNKLQPVNDPVVNADWSLQPGTGTNPRARYSVHFHRAGLSKSTPAAVVIGSAVVDSPGWGFVNHSSHVDMINNVAFDVHGAAFTTEVGDEIGSFRGNLAIGTSGSGEGVESRQYISDFGHRGDGFWFQGVGVTVTGNIAAGNQGSAFAYYARGLVEGGVKKEFVSANLPDPSIAGDAPTIDVGKMPVTGFKNNIGYASGEGLIAWYLMENETAGRYSALQDSLFWNNNVGVDIPYSHQTILHTLTVVYETQNGEAAPFWGVRTNSLSQEIVFENLTVSGYVTGILLPRRGYSVVSGGNLSNRYDILVYSGIGRNALITGLQSVPRIVMAVDMRALSASIDHVLLEDVVTLNFGPFQNQRLYYTQQTPDYVVFPEPREGVPSALIGLTNGQLWSQFGIALGGAIAPANAFTVPEIVGLIGPVL